MRITALVENMTPSSRYRARHGLSLWIEAGDLRILFDMGPDDSFLHNAAALGIDAAAADAAVVSHGHADHGGGLGAYLSASAERGYRAPVYLRPHAFDEHLSGAPGNLRPIGLDTSLAADPRLVVTGDRLEIAPGLILFATSTRPHPEPASNARLHRRPEPCGAPALDDFSHEQSLLVADRGRSVLVTACSHAGILNIIERAERIAGSPLAAVVGGFHLTAPSAGTAECGETVQALARELARRPTCYWTCHCTGLEAFGALRDELHDRVRYLYTGETVEIKE